MIFTLYYVALKQERNTHKPKKPSGNAADHYLAIPLTVCCCCCRCCHHIFFSWKKKKKKK